MFLEFFYELRRRKVPVATQEWLTLLRALEMGLHDSSFDGFYQLARTVLIKNVSHYDAFDAAFLATFKGVEDAAFELANELLDWLNDPIARRDLSDEDRRLIESLDPEALRKMFEERLKEQKERHDGGNRWVGTGGTSPFGRGGYHPSGMSVGGGGGRSAMQVAEERRFAAYRTDVVLDVRQIDLALRLLRDLGREGAVEELDIDETIEATARNAGDIEVVMRAPRRNKVKVVLLMDVGGSMDPHAELVSRLFTAASRNGRFARFRAYYFHNCIYDVVYEDARFTKPVSVADLLHSTSRDEKLVIVGDAAMHPAELLQAFGSIHYRAATRTASIEWMRRISEHFRRTIWLNPDPEEYWSNTTVKILRGLYPMFPLTLDGLGRAVKHLVRGGEKPLQSSK